MNATKQLTLEQHYLNALPSAVIAVDKTLRITYVNTAAEMLLASSTSQLLGRELSSIPGFNADLCSLGERLFATAESVSLREQKLLLPFNHRTVNMHLTPVMGEGTTATHVLITIEKSDGLDRVTASEWKQEMMRAAGVMAAMLAHEVKNPLSGIRGAAQLLKDEATPEHQALTDLICSETDRIRDLLAQVEVFTDEPVEKQPVNIHEVLQYVISVARPGFARDVDFKERYDPSLPPVMARRDLLVQLFLNLVKNAAEALNGQADATITISTGYRSGSRLRVGSDQRISLPVAVTIADNGPGLPESIREHLFEPFVSSKEEGRGLGLAIVAKIASDLGAVVELEQKSQGTGFTVLLAHA